MNDVTVVCRKELIAKCAACERLDREPTEHQTPEDTRIAFTRFLNHLGRKHRYDAEAQSRIFDHTTDCQKCIELDVIERGLRERDDRASDGVYGDHNL